MGDSHTGGFEVIPAIYFRCRDCAPRSVPDGTWTDSPAYCGWCRSHKVGGGWFVAVPPPKPTTTTTTTTTTNPTVKLKRKPSAALTRALTLLRASSELPPDAGWECVSKAREILEREVE